MLIDYDAIVERIGENVEEFVAKRIGPVIRESGEGVITVCPACHAPRCWVGSHGFKCHSCDESGGFFKLHSLRQTGDQRFAAISICRMMEWDDLLEGG